MMVVIPVSFPIKLQQTINPIYLLNSAYPVIAKEKIPKEKGFASIVKGVIGYQTMGTVKRFRSV